MNDDQFDRDNYPYQRDLPDGCLWASVAVIVAVVAIAVAIVILCWINDLP